MVNLKDLVVQRKMAANFIGKKIGEFNSHAEYHNELIDKACGIHKEIITTRKKITDIFEELEPMDNVLEDIHPGWKKMKEEAFSDMDISPDQI